MPGGLETGAASRAGIPKSLPMHSKSVYYGEPFATFFDVRHTVTKDVAVL
jgi:hypothetical protein